MYRVRGAAAVKEGVEKAFGAALTAEPAVVEGEAATSAGRRFVNSVNAAIVRGLAMCESTDKIHKGGSAAFKLAQGVQKLLEWGKDAIQ
jgi:hypothetical protein